MWQKIKRILGELKEYKKSSLLSPLFMIGEVVLEISLPFLMSFIIDEGVNKGNMVIIVKLGIVMLVCAFASLACGMLSAKYASHASTGLAKNLRNAMFEKIQKFSFKNVDNFSTAGLITRLMSDVTNVQNAYQMVIRTCVRAPMIIIMAMIMTININARLACTYVVAALILGGAIALIFKFAYKYFSQMFDKYDALNASLQENITNMRVVKAYVKEDDERDKFHFATKAISNISIKAERLAILNNPIMQLCTYSCIMIISYLGAKEIVGGSMTTGKLMSMLTYTTNILMALMMLSMILIMVVMSLPSIRRINQVFEEEIDIVSKDGAIMEVSDGSIKFDHVSFNYSDDAQEAVLQDINIEIKSGETIGILASTGSGKTSLVQLIARLYDVSEGTLYVGGKNVKDYDLKVLRDQVAMVLQKNVLFSGTIEENLRWGKEDATRSEIETVCKQAQAHEFIEKFPKGYETYIEQGGSNVSGGQKQRLCIARALLKQPKIMILDDSTSAVDTKTDASIRKAFNEELKDMTKIIISQRISSIENADRILVLDDGKVDGFDTPQALLKTNKIYQEVYYTQVNDKKEED